MSALERAIGMGQAKALDAEAERLEKAPGLKPAWPFRSAG